MTVEPTVLLSGLAEAVQSEMVPTETRKRAAASGWDMPASCMCTRIVKRWTGV